MMFQNYPEIDSLSTSGWLEEDKNAIKSLFRVILDSMVDFVDMMVAGDFFEKFPSMSKYIDINTDGHVTNGEVQNKILAAILASYLHHAALDLQSKEYGLSCKLYEDVLDEMGRGDVKTYFWLLDNHYRRTRNDAYGKHGWQIVKMILFASADNTSRYGLLDDTLMANYVVGNTIIANGLLWQLTNGEVNLLPHDVKRDVTIEFAQMFDGYFKMNPPKYAQ